MAVFPISPSANDTTTIGGTTYIYTGVAWRVVTGNVAITTFAATPHSNPDLGDFWYNTTSNILYMRVEDGASTDLWLDISTAGGEGLWTAIPEVASLDGSMALKKRSSSPTATADYAKMYSKDIVLSPVVGEALFHLNDTVDDEFGNHSGTPSNLNYAVSGAGGAGASGFGKAAVFNGATSSASKVIFPEVAIGTSDFTIEFWVKMDDLTKGNTFVSTTTASAGVGELILYHLTGNQIKIAYWQSSGSSAYDIWTFSGDEFTSTKWHHLAFVREGLVHSLYVGDAGNTTGKLQGGPWSHAAHSIGTGDDWALGEMRGGAGGLNVYNFDGQLDEVLISKVAKYSGSTYTLPAIPYVVASTTITKLFSKDSGGVETILTPGASVQSIWSGAPEDASLDGVVAVKKQTAAPSATADYAKIYSKEVPGISDAEALYTFDGNVLDSSGNSPANNGTAANLNYVSGMFSNAGDFNGTTSQVVISEIDFGNGPFTVEYFVKFDSFNSLGKFIISTHNLQASGSAGYMGIYHKSGDMTVGFWNGNYVNYTFTVSHGIGTWYHVAICRDSFGNLYGFFTPASSSNATLIDTKTGTGTHDVSGGYDWQIGMKRGLTSVPDQMHDGQIDELLITKTARYTSSYVIPVSPYSSGTATKIFAMDSLGNETQITP